MIEEGEKGGSPSTTEKLSASELSELERMANSNAHSGQAWVNVILREYSELKQCNRVCELRASGPPERNSGYSTEAAQAVAMQENVDSTLPELLIFQEQPKLQICNF